MKQFTISNLGIDQKTKGCLIQGMHFINDNRKFEKLEKLKIVN